jgi:hypothetical protein
MTWPAAAGIMVYAGGSAYGASLTAPAGAIVGTTDTQTLTNKTVDGVTPTTMGYVDPTSSIQTQLNGKQASFTSQTANYFFAAPNGSSGTPLFRAIVAADIPTLNQNTTGTAANLSGTPALPNGTKATTQTAGDNSTNLATTAFVLANAGGGCTNNCTIGTTSAATIPLIVNGATGQSTSLQKWTVNGSSRASIDQYGNFSGNSIAIGGGTSTMQNLALSGSLIYSGSATSVSCSTSGTAKFSTPIYAGYAGGTIEGKVIIVLSACVGTATYTFNSNAFSQLPGIFPSSTVSAALVTTLSTSAVTITGATSTGVIILDGF